MALRIPERDRDRLAVLFRLESTALDVLFDVLKERPPQLKVEDLVANIQQDVPIAKAALRDVLTILVTLYWLGADRQLSPETLVKQLFEAIDDSGDERLKVSHDARPKLEECLTKLLSLERTLGVTARALYVAYQFPRHYHGARVLTDARPVFTANASDPPAAFIINHTLKLTIHDDGKNREWFVSMNTDDLAELAKVITRAIEKEKSLKALMAKTSVPILEWHDDGDEHGN